MRGPLTVPGRDSLPVVGGKRGTPSFLIVTPSYFRVAGIHLVQGRLLTDADRADGDFDVSTFRAVVVNETMARALWPGQSAIGKCLIVLGPAHGCTPVVGVVTNEHLNAIIEPDVMLYMLPLWHHGGDDIAVRSRPGALGSVAGQLTRALRERFPAARPPLVRSMAAALAPQLRPWQLGVELFGGFGVLALIIAAIGVYAVVSYSVAERTREIGIRIALGARTGHVLRLVVRDGTRAVGIGIVVGAGLTWAAGRLLQSSLYETSPHDPVVMACATIVLSGCAVVASLVPAWRASLVDPVGALRAD